MVLNAAKLFEMKKLANPLQKLSTFKISHVIN